jgi:hypothetical protein
MKKLEFLVGKWSGEARIFRAEPVVMTQTEEAQYKLDGLVLVIEGVGLTQALGVVSYDDESGKYTMRAFNDGRFLETEVKVDGNSITWGFALEQIRTSALLRIDEKGDWTELHEITIGSQLPKKYMELRISRWK